LLNAFSELILQNSILEERMTGLAHRITRKLSIFYQPSLFLNLAGNTLHAMGRRYSSHIKPLIQSAIFLALVFLTQDGEIHAIEPIIATWLSFGALSSLSANGINPLDACWLWFGGLDDMLEAEKGCSIVTFFGGVTIEGSFRTYNKGAPFKGAVICAIFAVASMFKITNAFQRATYQKGYSVEMSFLLFSLTVIIVSISAVEYLVRANGITGIWEIAAVGQLLPLLSGIFGLLEVLYDIDIKRLWRLSRCWVLFNHHLS
jgi:hypothetical protein